MHVNRLSGSCLVPCLNSRQPKIALALLMDEPPQKSVLVVEDDAIIAFAFKTILEEGGWKVHGPAASIEQALHIITTVQPIDAALVDVLLHGREAGPVADALNRRHIPFGLVSGLRRQDLSIVLRRAPWLPKPCSAQKLLNMAQRLKDDDYDLVTLYHHDHHEVDDQ